MPLPASPAGQGQLSPFALPRLPAAQVERAARLLRRVWATRRRCAAWLWYLHVAERRWRGFLAPQMCAPDGVRLNCTFPGCDAPPPDLRLAGSFACSGDTPAEELTGRLPAYDGVHLFLDSARWLSLTAFVVAGGNPLPVPPTTLLRDRSSREQRRLCQRLWFVDHL